MRLRRLISILPGPKLSHPDDPEIRDITYDSRQVRRGSLFISVPSVGGRDDKAVAYALEAQAAGAVAILSQRSYDGVTVPQVLVNDVRKALADVAAEFFGHPSHHLRLFAITGTDGKTTTAYLTEQILAAAGRRTGLIGTIEVKFPGHQQSNVERMTTPESVDLQRLLRSMVDAGVTHAVLEASSHALALQRLRGCEFAACAMTNITADHAEFHGSPEAYFQAKASLFTELAAHKPAALNRDDAHYDRLASLVSGAVWSYGLHPEARVRGIELQSSAEGHSFVLALGDDRASIVLPLPGRFNVHNALAAITLALIDGIHLDVAALALTDAQLPPGRMQRIPSRRGFEVIIDYAHTVNAFRSVLETARMGRNDAQVIAVFGAAGDRDRDKRPVLAELATRYTDFFVITNEDPFSEDAGVIIDEIAAGADWAEEGTRYLRERDRGKAIELAIERARPGDLVLVLGKGHEQSIMTNGHKQPWSDVETVREKLATLDRAMEKKNASGGKRAVLVCNPLAGKRAAEGGLDPAMEVFARAGWSVSVYNTSGRRDATRIAEEALAERMDAILVAGGDGTINEVLQAIANRPIALGHLPYGTVNIWARELDIPFDAKGAAEVIVDGRIESVDLGRAGDRYFLLMAGIGFDGEVVRRAHQVSQYKHRIGVLSYAAASMLTAPFFHGADLELRYDGVTRSVEAVMVIVGNTRLYGGRFYFTPDAVANDGLLDICIVKGRGPLALARQSVPFLLSRPSTDIEQFRVRRLGIRSEEPLAVQVDGEVDGHTPLDISVAPGALRAIVPPDFNSDLIKQRKGTGARKP